MPFETDERLKSYLDTNQLQRERLCLALLALDRRFSDVRARHPHGGPDEGRDIEAIFNRSSRCFGAVGFINQANDSPKQKRDIKKKFQSDLTAARRAAPQLSAFMFFTNVNLTIGEKVDLDQLARKAGVEYSEVFDRERLRILLDAPDGLSLRFQYLGLALSEAEQATFFARWGDDIQAVISTGFGSLRKALARIHFFQEASFPLTHLTISLELDRVYKPEEIGHFRAFVHLQLKAPVEGLLNIFFGAADNSSRQEAGSAADINPADSGIGRSVCGQQWEQKFPPEFWDSDEIGKLLGVNEGEEKLEVRYPFRKAGSFRSVGYKSVESVRLSYTKSSFIQTKRGPRLQDLDECIFAILLNSSLAEKVHKIKVVANEYVLQEFSKDSFHVSTSDGDPDIEYNFTEEELADAWAILRPESASAFHLRFSEETPQRFYKAVDVI